ncbi:MAG: UrcA family protein [Erythrobacter sp.]
MQKHFRYIAAIVVATAMPHVAHAGERVDFAYNAKELATAATRQALLERIETVSFRSCETSSAIAPRDAVDRCAADLRDQFVKAIADDNLTLLAKSGSKTAFQSASR